MNSHPNFLYDVPVTLSSSAGTLGILVETVRLMPGWSFHRVWASPRDFEIRTWNGGTIAFSGIVRKDGDVGLFSQGFLETILVGTFCQLYSCRKTSSAVGMQSPGVDNLFLGATLSYKFDGINHL